MTDGEIVEADLRVCRAADAVEKFVVPLYTKYESGNDDFSKEEQSEFSRLMVCMFAAVQNRRKVRGSL
jgi:hypothetical protein